MSLTCCLPLQSGRAQQAGVSPWILGGAGLAALIGLGLGLTTVGTESVSSIAESSQGEQRNQGLQCVSTAA